MEAILEIIIFLTTMSVFIINMDFRYSRKKVVLILVICGIICFLSYGVVLAHGVNRVLASGLCFSIPTLILCWFISAYRNSRFIFTFATVDLFAMIIVFMVKIIANLLKFNAQGIFVATVLLLIIYFLLAFRFRLKYINILRTIKFGWNYMAFVSILFYLMTFMIVAYPTPLNLRQEYIPTAVLYFLTVILIYRVIYQAVSNNIIIYNEKTENNLLKVKLELQESQLNLQQSYYDMAYKDGLTKMMNRAAFEKYKSELKSMKKTNVICVSMDLNNLKQTNDTFGHSAGDTIIKDFAGVLKSVFEKQGKLFRIGGDEFLLIFEDSSHITIDKLQTKLNDKIEKDSHIHKYKLEYAFGIGCGMSEKIDDLLKEADNNMYGDKERQKLSGK